MSQADVYKTLKESKKELTVRDIDDILSININNITRSLRKLYKQGKNTLGLTRNRKEGFKCYFWKVDVKNG